MADDLINDLAREKLLACRFVAPLPELHWEEHDVLAAGLEALGELGILRDAETPYEPLIVQSLLTAVREAQLGIERRLMIVPDLGAIRERRMAIGRRQSDRRPSLESAILSDENLTPNEREGFVALYRALLRRTDAASG